MFNVSPGMPQKSVPSLSEVLECESCAQCELHTYTRIHFKLEHFAHILLISINLHMDNKRYVSVFCPQSNTMRFVQSDLFKNNNREAVLIPPTLHNISDDSTNRNEGIAPHHQLSAAYQERRNYTSFQNGSDNETDSVCITSPDAVSFRKNHFLHAIGHTSTQSDDLVGLTTVDAVAANGNELEETARNSSAIPSEEDRRNLNLQQVPRVSTMLFGDRFAHVCKH